MNEQITLFSTGEDTAELERQIVLTNKYINRKRRWESAFQKWSDDNPTKGLDSYGCCGYGSMCDWCEDNSYGRPCVRALNEMLRDKRIVLDYKKRNFEDIWNGVFEK